MMNTNTIEVKATSTDTVDLYFDGTILTIKVKENADFTLANSINDRLVAKELTGDKKVLVLIDARNHFLVSDEGMKYAASKEGNMNRKAIAYFTNTPSSKIVLNFFLCTIKPSVPCQIFGNERTAKQWLLTKNLNCK